MKPSSKHIKDMLEDDSSLGLTFKDNLFIGIEPATPDNCVTIIDTPGGAVHLALQKKYSDYYYPSVQIRIRHNDYIIGWELAEDIVISLHARAGETWDSMYYTLVRCVNGPSKMDHDKNERYIFITNFEIQRR